MKNEPVKFRCGHKLKAVRERRGLTLQNLSESCGLSKGMLSQIENNKVSPSLDSLLLLASFLGIDLEYLFQEYKQSRPVRIIRKNERNRQILGRVCYEKLTQETAGENSIEAYELTIPAGEERGDAEYGHQGWEMGVITSGTGLLIYGDSEYMMQEGDSVSFESDIPHIFRNTGETDLKAIWVLTPPKGSF